MGCLKSLVFANWGGGFVLLGSNGPFGFLGYDLSSVLRFFVGFGDLWRSCFWRVGHGVLSCAVGVLASVVIVRSCFSFPPLML